MFFLAPPSLTMLTIRLRYIVGGVLSKGETGLITVAGRASRYTQPFEEQSAFAILENEQEADPELQAKCEEFAAAPVPFVRVPISKANDLLAETFKWELASVLAAARLQVDAFDWPDVRPARRGAMEMLDNLAVHSETLVRTPRLQDRGIAL